MNQTWNQFIWVGIPSVTSSGTYRIEVDQKKIPDFFQNN